MNFKYVAKWSQIISLGFRNEDWKLSMFFRFHKALSWPMISGDYDEVFHSAWATLKKQLLTGRIGGIKRMNKNSLCHRNNGNSCWGIFVEAHQKIIHRLERFFKLFYSWFYGKNNHLNSNICQCRYYIFSSMLFEFVEPLTLIVRLPCYFFYSEKNHFSKISK